MTEQFINPITVGFHLLEQYRNLLLTTLLQQGLSEKDAADVLERTEVDKGLFFSLNRTYKQGRTSFAQFCANHGLVRTLPDMFPDLHRLYRHQESAIESILAERSTILSTGTGSGKTETFLVPILHHCLTHPGPGVKALIVYPMNALANDQVRRIQEATHERGIRAGLLTGATPEEEREQLRSDPPDILITNYVMLDWMLTRRKDRDLFLASRETLRYIVLDELHSYRGIKATHLKYLLARLKVLLARKPIQIGTSATLRSRDQEGYLLDDSGTALTRFVQTLLDVGSFDFIEAEYEPEPTPPDLIEVPSVPAEQPLGWALTADVPSALDTLGRLTGQAYNALDQATDSYTTARPYQDLQRTRFVVELRRLLADEGAQSFRDIVALLARILSASVPAERLDEMAQSYLSAIAFVNHQARNERAPLLDFRVHLWLKNISGYLKRCLHCQSYHVGRQEYCQECGSPLFFVYRHNITQCVGKLVRGRLRSVLQAESSDAPSFTQYVLIALTDMSEGDSALRFNWTEQPDETELLLDHDAQGALRVHPLPLMRTRDIYQILVALADNRADHQYLFHLVRSILDFQPSHQRKLLGFVDNREQVSRYASILRDEFASRYFQAFLHCYYPTERSLSLDQTFPLLQRHIPAGLSERERKLFDELELWLFRLVGQSPRLRAGIHDVLALRNPETFSELDRELLDIFLAERAIWKARIPDDSKSHFIRFRTYLATTRRGIYRDPAANSADPNYPGISLTANAREYEEFVKQHGADVISSTLNDLVTRGTLHAHSTPDGKRHFYLDPRAVYLRLPADEAVEDFEEIRHRLFLDTAAHSSEIKEDARRATEQGFQRGEIQVVMATPTLEMGIDIGKLQTVLMVGVPPLPSNYAQRAGRADRAQGDNYALIVTFCSEENDHDRYYFEHPTRMINGAISPPTFDPCIASVVHQHVNAFLLADHLDAASLQRFARRIHEAIHDRRADVAALFGSCGPTALAYLLQEFAPALDAQLPHALTHRGSPQSYFYQSGFFPGFAFRRDEVYVIDQANSEKTQQDERLLADLALSAREPELAYTKFSPGTTLFMAGDVYTLSARGKWELLELPDGAPTRCYQVFEAERQTKYATQDKPLQRFDRFQWFAPPKTYTDKKRVLAIAYIPDCQLLFENRGLLTPEGTKPFTDSDTPFRIAYDLRREALILRFDRAVCAAPRLPLSLVSVLDRTIKDRYGMDESEIRPLIDANPLSGRDEASLYVIFYDVAGGGATPLRRIYEEFDQVVALAYRRLSECAGPEGQGCAEGCYGCLKSYAMHFHAYEVDKATAKMFTAFLVVGLLTRGGSGGAES